VYSVLKQERAQVKIVITIIVIVSVKLKMKFVASSFKGTLIFPYPGEKIRDPGNEVEFVGPRDSRDLIRLGISFEPIDERIGC